MESLERRLLLSRTTFDAAALYVSGLNPDDVTAADFDGDGWTDLAVANRDEGIPPEPAVVSVFRNKGDGTFANKADYPTGLAGLSVASADVSGDGKPDLVLVGKTVAILRNKGDGTFAPKVVYDVGALGGWAVTIADLDGDGWNDLAVATQSNTGLAILRNKGDGTFAAKVTYVTSIDLRSVTAADFDGDGRVDLAVGNYKGTVDVLRNAGRGSFAAPVKYVVGGGREAYVTSADTNSDGRPELAVGCGPTLTVLRNNGNGGFSPGSSHPVSQHVQSVTSADFSGDGVPDLAVASLGDGITPGKLTVLNFFANGTMAVRADYTTASDAWAVTGADFDRDGRADLAVVEHPINIPQGTVTVMRNGGKGDFLEAVRNIPGSYPYGLAATDFDGDNRPDLAVAGINGVSVLRNTGGRAFATRVNYATGSSYQAITTADFDGDGWSDLAVAVPADGASTIDVLRNNGDGTFAPKRSYAAGAQSRSLASADFDRDGRPDLAVANWGSASTGGGTVSVLRNNPDGTFAPPVDYPAGFNSDAVTTADFDGDGWADLAVADYAKRRVSVFRNNGDGTFANPSDYASNGGRAMVSADMTGDGRPELIFADIPGKAVRVLLNDGHGAFFPWAYHAVGEVPASIAVADLDGDGAPNLVVSYRRNAYSRFVIRVFQNDGTVIDYLTGSNGAGSLLGTDFDGDGRTDLAWLDDSYDFAVVTLRNTADFPPRALPATFSPAPTAITVAFSENVSLDPDDLVVIPRSGGSPLSPTSVTFDPATNTARFAFAAPLPDGDYRATIQAATVVDAANQPLSGDVALDFFVLAGDANRDRAVNFTDLLALAKNYGKPGTWSQGDFTGDGAVNFTDLLVLAKAYNQSLPTPPPALAAALPPSADKKEERPAQALFSTTPVVAPVPAAAAAAAAAAAKPKTAARPARR